MLLFHTTFTYSDAPLYSHLRTGVKVWLLNQLRPLFASRAVWIYFGKKQKLLVFTFSPWEFEPLTSLHKTTSLCFGRTLSHFCTPHQARDGSACCYRCICTCTGSLEAPQSPVGFYSRATAQTDMTPKDRAPGVLGDLWTVIGMYSIGSSHPNVQYTVCVCLCKWTPTYNLLFYTNSEWQHVEK